MDAKKNRQTFFRNCITNTVQLNYYHGWYHIFTSTIPSLSADFAVKMCLSVCTFVCLSVTTLGIVSKRAIKYSAINSDATSDL